MKLSELLAGIKNFKVFGAPGEVWCVLQGESPCRARTNHPPVSSVASVAEVFFLGRTRQAKRTQRIMQAVGETAFPEVLV